MNLFKNMKAYRHGENLLLKVNKIPKSATKSNSNIFATGSHGHDHSIVNGELFNDNGILYLKANNTSLLHPEHSPKEGDAKIQDGFYKIITQVEYTPEGLKPVID